MKDGKPTNYDFFELTDQWISAVEDRYKNFKQSELNQVFMRGPFSGWSERELLEFAQKLRENWKKYPR